MSEWREYKLSDIAEITTGFPFKGNKYTSTGIKVVRGENVTIGDLRWDSIKCWDEDFDQFDKYSLKKGDVVIGMDGSRVGKNRAQIRETDLPLLLAQRVACVRAKIGYSQDLIAYLIKSNRFERYVEMVHTGTSIPHISQKQIEEFTITIPQSLSTQTAIAEILSSLDDKIELNNKINKELEALAQTLFKQWFIDFEFPNKNGEPYKSSGGEMVESELGEIPKGWKIKTLADISNITIGRTPPRQEHQWFSTDVNDYKWISIRDMGNCGTYIYSTSEYLTEEAVVKFNVPIIDINTVILSFKLTVGRVSITTERMLSNEAIAHLNLQGTFIFPEFLYLYLKQFNFDTLGSTSSIATAVNSKSIKSIPLISPSEEVLLKFKELVLSLFSRINNLTFENRDLENLRDTILPKLISGELEVKELSN